MAPSGHNIASTRNGQSQGQLLLFAETSNKNATMGLNESVRTKLLTESIAPWRSLRLFLYGALGSGALIGGLINLSGLAAVVSGSKEGEISTNLLNVSIDLGAVALFVFLFRWDFRKQAELNEKVEERIEKKKELKLLEKSIKDRERKLGNLRLDVQVSAAGDTKDASIKELQVGARQHMILVIGPKKACRDALVGANLLKMDFAMSNVIVVPCEIGTDPAEQRSRPEGTGFGDRPMYETQPYVARPTGEGWTEYVAAELADAIKQNGEKVKSEGIVLVISSNGKVIRRGVGKIPWRAVVEQLDQSIGGGPEKEPSLF